MKIKSTLCLGKVQVLAPVLTSRGASIKGKEKYTWPCIQSVLGYVSETYVMKVEDMA